MQESTRQFGKELIRCLVQERALEATTNPQAYTQRVRNALSTHFLRGDKIKTGRIERIEHRGYKPTGFFYAEHKLVLDQLSMQIFRFPDLAAGRETPALFCLGLWQADGYPPS